jgi:hypothetical protein
MAIKLCHHIRENGVLCNAAALRGRDYCYSHLTFRGRRMRAAQQRARSSAWRLELPLLEDLNAVQVGVMQVVDALIDDRIDRHRAGLILYGLQQAANNLRGKEHRVCLAVSPDTENRCVSYDSFEEDFELTPADGPGEITDPLTATAQDGENPTPPSAEDHGGEASAAGGKIAAEPAAATPCSIIIDKIHAVAEDEDEDEGEDEEDRQAPAKPPRGLRPPIAERQSGEAALAISPECGRDHEGKVKPCAKCEVKLYKRLAQYWEGASQPPGWLPRTGTMECADCTYRHLTTLGRHLEEKMPAPFLLYMDAQEDGGPDPGDIDDFLLAFTAAIKECDRLPADQQISSELYTRFLNRYYRSRERKPVEGELEGDELEEGDVSA